MPSLVPSHFDVMVIGGGPAGYAAAIRSSQLGAKVVLIEKDQLGGACLNYACVPTKFLRYTGELLHCIEKAPRYGIAAEIKDASWATIQTRRQNLIDSQQGGMMDFLGGHNINFVYGEARLLKGRVVSVTSEARESFYSANRIIIATGSTSARLDVPGSEYFISARELFCLDTLPRSLAIIGGGPVGVELASVFTRLGSTVSLVEALPRILPSEDAELVGLLEKELKRSRISLYTASCVDSVEKIERGYRLRLSGKEGEAIEAEQAVLCIGQRPYLGGLMEAGLVVRRGALKVDRHLYTGTDGIYAAGDVTGKAMLAYVATMQGRVAAENALGRSTLMRYDAIPRCVFSTPELAGVGLTEESARVAGWDVKIGRSLLSTNVASAIYGERRGVVKIVTDAKSGRLLGVHILGHQAPELIHEATLAIKTRASIRDIQQTLHIHPSLTEALWEAALNVTEETAGAKNSTAT